MGKHVLTLENINIVPLIYYTKWTTWKYGKIPYFSIPIHPLTQADLGGDVFLFFIQFFFFFFSESEYYSLPYFMSLRTRHRSLSCQHFVRKWEGKKNVYLAYILVWAFGDMWPLCEGIWQQEKFWSTAYWILYFLFITLF